MRYGNTETTTSRAASEGKYGFLNRLKGLGDDIYIELEYQTDAAQPQLPQTTPLFRDVTGRCKEMAVRHPCCWAAKATCY